MKRIILIFLITLTVFTAFSQEEIGITGVIDWENMQIRSTVTLDLASAGLRLPAGRTIAESKLAEGYTYLIRTAFLELQADSSSSILDLIERNEFSLAQIDAISELSQKLPPYLSSDMRKISASYSIPVSAVNNALQRHLRPTPVPVILNPVTAANYTGIIIIASENLPAHGMRSSMLPIPCLFPKIWDSEMNLIYERNMVEPGNIMVRYSSSKNILYRTPSGLSPELEAITGERPLRIFARGVFGMKPTDLIIDRADALQIISSEANRNLLAQGRVVFILDESALTQEFSLE